MADGAPGKPGMQVLKAATSEKGPLPHELMPHTRNLYALPGWSSTLCTLGACVCVGVEGVECVCVAVVCVWGGGWYITLIVIIISA